MKRFYALMNPTATVVVLLALTACSTSQEQGATAPIINTENRAITPTLDALSLVNQELRDRFRLTISEGSVLELRPVPPPF